MHRRKSNEYGVDIAVEEVFERAGGGVGMNLLLSALMEIILPTQGNILWIKQDYSYPSSIFKDKTTFVDYVPSPSDFCKAPQPN
jgi:hypothetical protein